MVKELQVALYSNKSKFKSRVMVWKSNTLIKSKKLYLVNLITGNFRTSQGSDLKRLIGYLMFASKQSSVQSRCSKLLSCQVTIIQLIKSQHILSRSWTLTISPTLIWPSNHWVKFIMTSSGVAKSVRSSLIWTIAIQSQYSPKIKRSSWTNIWTVSN